MLVLTTAPGGNNATAVSSAGIKSRVTAAKLCAASIDRPSMRSSVSRPAPLPWRCLRPHDQRLFRDGLRPRVPLECEP